MSGERGKGQPEPGGRGDEKGVAPSSLSFSPAELARARGRTYQLLSQLYLHGLTGETYPVVASVPELAGALAEPFDPDQAAAAHQHLFGFNVFPFESFFLDPSGLLGGPVTEAVLRDYGQVGYDVFDAAESADHVGHQLGLLAALSAAEAEAYKSHQAEVGHGLASQRLARQGSRFLQAHLLRWLPPLSLAVEQQEQPFYAALARLTLTFVLDHAGAETAQALVAVQLPQGPDLLGDERTSLGDIAAYLLTPAYSGLYLSRDDIGRLAREQRLPRGFGERRQMLLNLLRSAAQYDGLETILDRLIDLCTGWSAAYAEMGPIGRPWQRRAEETGRLLAEMGQRVAQLVD